MGSDYIPGSDAAFLAWAQNFVTYANGNFGALGLNLMDSDLLGVTSDLTDFDAKMTANVAAAQAAQAARQGKNDSRDTLEAVIRVLVRRLPLPVGADGLSFIMLDTASPHTAEYDGGMTAHYMLRWVKKNGDKGPWSGTVSSTITA